MADELKDQRIPIMMSPSEVKAIDDWAFARRIRSRGEAIRQLCRQGQYFDLMFETSVLGLAAGLHYANSKSIPVDVITNMSKKATEFGPALDAMKQLRLASKDSNQATALLDAAYETVNDKDTQG